MNEPSTTDCAKSSVTKLSVTCVQSKRHSCPDAMYLEKEQPNVVRLCTPDNQCSISKTGNLSSTSLNSTTDRANMCKKRHTHDERHNAPLSSAGAVSLSINNLTVKTPQPASLTQHNTSTNTVSSKFAKKWKWLLKKYRDRKLHINSSKNVHASQSLIISDKSAAGYNAEDLSRHIESTFTHKGSVPELSQSNGMVDWAHRSRHTSDDRSPAEIGYFRVKENPSLMEPHQPLIALDLPQVRRISPSPNIQPDKLARRVQFQRESSLRFKPFSGTREKRIIQKPSNHTTSHRDDKMLEQELDGPGAKVPSERRKTIMRTTDKLLHRTTYSIFPANNQSLSLNQSNHRALLNKIFRSNWPTVADVESWGQSFSNILHNKGGILLFREFLRTEFSDENIEFWLTCEDFRNNCGSKKLQSRAQKIFNEFVAVQSKREVNLDSTTRIQLEKELECVTRNTFDQSQKRIQALMEKDSYSRFLRSDLYTATLDYFRRLSGIDAGPDDASNTVLSVQNEYTVRKVQMSAGYQQDSMIPGLLPNVKPPREIASRSSRHQTGSLSAPSSPKYRGQSRDTIENPF